MGLIARPVAPGAAKHAYRPRCRALR
jgi:hypothetical protein